MLKLGRFLLPVLLVSSSVAHAALTCTISGAALPVRSEGLAERMGDVTLLCSGGSPGDHISGALFLLLTVPFTNRVLPDGTLNLPLTVVNGDGSIALVRYPVFAPVGVVFENIDFTLQGGGSATIRISNIRGAVASRDLSSATPITASVIFNGSQLALTSATVTVGLPARGFAASVNSIRVNCNLSPAPDSVSMAGLIAAGTRSLTVRITDRFLGALEKRQSGADSGVRVLLSYSGLPAGARLFVPDVVAGSDATQPTAGGDLALPRAAGLYTPTAAGSLLLARVSGADANGAGGSPVYIPLAPGSGTVALTAAAEIPLTNGAAQVVYEVVDNNVAALESAELPSFFSFTSTGGVIPPAGTVSVVIGPVSTVASATAADPIPRYVNVAPPVDCNLMNDCASFPSMRIQAPTLDFTAVPGGPSQDQWVFVTNDGGGALVWTATAAYQSGSGWLQINSRNQELGALLTISPQGLAPGLYQATLTIDGGSYAGVRILPVKLTVTSPAVRIDSISHAATYAQGPSVPGSLAMLKGQHLSGQLVSVTFDGIRAWILYTSDAQINLIVPSELASRSTSQVVVTVDGTQSQPYTVSLAPSNPGIFPNGVANLDGSGNSPTSPAQPGSFLIVYATGLPATGAITAKLGDRDIPLPDYAGPAPTLPGVQQVNLRIPAGLSSVTASLVVCGGGVCSPPVQATVR